MAAATAIAVAGCHGAWAQAPYATAPRSDAPPTAASQPAAKWHIGAARAWPLPVPVGLDAYRQWAMWPYQRIGVRAYMRSTYDRDGLNRTADASHFLYGERPDFNVTLDVLGRGILYFVRTNRWHGSPWHYEVDGIDHIVRETSTDHPDRPSHDSVFEPRTAFPPPLAWTWPTTRGADLNWVPIPFERSLRLAYGRTFYGTGYYIYHQFVDGIPLSSSFPSFDLNEAPDPEVLKLLALSGTDIAPKDIARTRGAPTLEPGQALRLLRLEGPRTLRALTLHLPAERALELSGARLRVTWDDRQEPSVDAPLALFFGAGILFNRDNTENLVKAFPVNIRYVGNAVQLACYFPMPFFRTATVEIIPPPGLARPVPLTFEIRTEPFSEDPRAVGYFHATYRDLGPGEPGKDHVLLDTRGTEGSEDWSGSFIGTSIAFTDRGELRTLEGDPRFFFDDARSPQAQGTGTEEWGGGGDYWGGRTMTLPLVGHPVGAPSPSESRGRHDLVHSTYRFLLADLFPFGKNARIQFEHGGANDVFEPYKAVTYWYGIPAATLLKSDELVLGDAESESEHGYRSSDSAPPETLVSRFDWGPDTYVSESSPPSDDARGSTGKALASEPGMFNRAMVYPAEAKLVRYTRGTSEFTLKVHPDNHGVMLRRTFDYALPNQRATVSVADGEAAEPVWEPAGVWYSAGSNTVYHSFPAGELDPPAPTVLTSNRRFREDEFLVPLRLTRGRHAIRVRMTFEPVVRPLLPGLPEVSSAWSEIQYDAYSWVLPSLEQVLGPR